MQKPVKPSKPRVDFPLFPNTNGQWCRKVWDRAAKKNVPYYFGPWSDDPQGNRALKDWLERKDGILAGLDRLRVPAVTTGMTLGALAKKYLTVRNNDLLAGHLSDEQFKDYTRDLLAFTGIVGVNAQVEAMTPEHFARYADHLRNKASEADPTARGLGPHAFKRTTANVKPLELQRLKRVAMTVYKRVFPKPKNVKATPQPVPPALRIVGGGGTDEQAA